MFRVKLLTVIVGMLTTLAVTAAPAFAEFSSNSAQTKGFVHTGTVVLEGGGATLECANSSGIWTITNAQGTAVTQGKNLRLDFEQFDGCTAKSSLIKGAKAIVKSCILELEQDPGQSMAIGSTVVACTVEVKVIGTCTITVEGGQKGLIENNLVNVGSNLEIIANDSGIKSKPSSACLGIKETTNAKEKATAIAEGLKWE